MTNPSLSRKPKILLFSHICRPDRITGAEKFLLLVAGELRPLADCVVVTPGGGMLAAEAAARGLETVTADYPIFPGLAAPWPGLPEAVEQAAAARLDPVTALLRRHRPDLVMPFTCINPLPAMAAKALGIPVAWMVTEIMAGGSFRGLSSGWIAGRADRIAGVSRAALEPFGGLKPPDRLAMLYPAWPKPPEPREQPEQPETPGSPGRQRLRSSLRARLRERLGLAESDVLMMFIAAELFPAKGLEHFVEAALRVAPRFPDVHFLAVGHPSDPPYFRDCLLKADAGGIGDRFIVAGFHPRTEELYPAADVVVVPSLIPEGFAMTALEGLAFGKPVVAYRSGGLAEVLEETGNAAFLVPAGDVAGLAERMAELAADPRLRRRTGRRNRLAARRAFGIEAFRGRLWTWIKGIFG
jgi:glycosyltransferase involved in cell wall biosynthesis